MFRVGIIGSENSHADGFMNIFANDPDYSDIKVVAVGGIDPEANKALYEKYKLEMIAEKPEDMLGKVDAVMVTARDGIYHAPYARPFLEAGLPMFIDKPFTVDEKEAVEFAQEAKRRGVPLVGGSGLRDIDDVLALKKEVLEKGDLVRGGTVNAPLDINSVYSGWFFYASHLTEISLKIFGYDPKAVTAFRRGNSVTAFVDYDKYSVTNSYVANCYHYFAQVFSQNAMCSKLLDVSQMFKKEGDEFADMLRHGKMSTTYEELIYPVFYMNAIKKSYETNQTVKLERVEL
ncbi:MAG: Gfo/Idh/MocA family oxidoreductase [Clostridia bacterium]|nr:Gfo/Idh/MocA family oxidoreductase [Clostridia bacterium]